MTTNVAVVIGINYTATPVPAGSAAAAGARVNPLRFAEADAAAMAAILQAQGYQVVPLIGAAATQDAIIDTLHQQRRAVSDDGLFLVYFAGHGDLDPDDPTVAYLLPADAAPDRLASTAIRLNDLAGWHLGQVPSALTLLDCCHSGYAVGVRGDAVPADVGRTFGEQAKNSFSGVADRVVVTACAGDQVARELADLQHGAFTHYVLDWWQHGDGDDDGSLYSYLDAALEKIGFPRPMRGGVQDRRYVLRPAPAPATAASTPESGPPAADPAWRAEIAGLLGPLTTGQLRRLVYRLGRDYDALPGDDRQSKTIRLVIDMEAAGQAATLTAAAREARAAQTRDEQLYQLLATGLDPARLPALCAAVGVDPAGLAGDDPSARIRALIEDREWAGTFDQFQTTALSFLGAGAAKDPPTPLPTAGREATMLSAVMPAAVEPNPAAGGGATVAQPGDGNLPSPPRGGAGGEVASAAAAGGAGGEVAPAVAPGEARLTLSAPGFLKKVFGAAWSPDGTRIVTAESDGTARVWDAATGALRLSIRGHGGAAPWLYCADWSPDGANIVTGADDKTAIVWTAEGGQQRFALRGHTGTVRCAVWSPDSRRIVTASEDKTAKLWDATTGQDLLTLRGHDGQVRGAAWHPDGQRVITGSADKTAIIWDATTGAAALTLRGHTGAVTSVAFSPDGGRVLTASEDGSAQVWDAASGQALFAVHSHAGWFDTPKIFTCAVWSPDGRYLLTAGEDKTATLWAAAGGPEVLTLRGHGGQINSAAFRPDSRQAVTASDDNTARVWDIPA